MNPEWQKFLKDTGALITADKIESYGNTSPPALDENLISDMSHFGLISARGEDAQTFLHNQFSNDLSQVSETRSQLSAYCNPKGRMLANFRVFKRNDAYYLRMPEALVETILKRLRMFVLMSKVSLENASDELVRFGCSGPDIEKALEPLLGTLPQTIDECIQCDDISVLRIPGAHPRFELYGGLGTMKKLWSALDKYVVPATASTWSLLDIRAGIPNILPQTSEAFVPQMTNLELVGGVSFKKGCYPGQEVVARMHYLGKLKRRMYRVHIDSDTTPEPGSELFKANTEGEPVGKLVDAQASATDGTEALAVLQIKSAERDDLRLGAADGAVVKVLDLPYSLEAAS